VKHAGTRKQLDPIAQIDQAAVAFLRGLVKKHFADQVAPTDLPGYYAFVHAWRETWETDVTNMVRLAIIFIMRTVNLSDLKARLSAHIQLVKDGEEVIVCDRNKPVARIVPCRLVDHSEQERRLVVRAVLKPPAKRRPAPVSWPQPPGDVSDEVMEQVWREERESR